MTPQCFWCGKSDGLSAYRLLLTCSVCRKSWHHRCHVPPVSDNELIARIKATDPANGLSAWRCRACIPERNSPPSIGPVIDLTMLSDNDKETCMVDLTTLSDCSSNEDPHLSSISIDDSSVTKSVATKQVRHEENNDAIPAIEWNTCRVHQSIPEIAPLSWMRRALHNRQRAQSSHWSKAARSETFYFHVGDLVVFIQNTPL